MPYNKDTLSKIQHHLTLPFYASALYDFKDGKKIHKYHLKDKTPLSTQKRFNVAKAYLADNILVFDFDDPDMDKEHYYKLFPSLTTTLATTSSNEDKHHYYLRYTSSDLDSIRDTRSIPGLDILTTGVIQEAYPSSIVLTDAPVLTLTQEEEQLLKTLLSQNSKSSKVVPGTFYINYSALTHINNFINNGMPTTRAKLKLLLAALLPQSIYNKDFKSKKGTIVFPALDYQLFNDIITKASYNRAISVDRRKELIEALLHHYGIDPNSSQTQTRLGQILPSLPCNEGYVEADYDNFANYVKPTHLPLYQSFIIKYVVNKDTVYTLIDEATHKPKEVSQEGFQLSKNSLAMFVNEQVQRDLAEGLYGSDSNLAKLIEQCIAQVPLVKPINHPSEPRITFSDSLLIPQYNTAEVSKYVEQATPVPQLNESPLSRLLHSVLGQYQDFYFHLLAHQIYNPNPPQTVMFIVSPETATGKTTIASAIPQALMASARGVSLDDIKSGWGDILTATKWLGINDLMNLTKQEWELLYAFIKNTTTGGQRRLINKKYGGISTATLPTISMAVSSNNYYPVESNDRRLWVIRPQHLEIDDEGIAPTSPLNQADANIIYNMFEANPTNYYDDLQDLANYLLHLYQSEPNKYAKELTQRAPMTPYKQNMIDKHSTYTSRILPSIVEGPSVFNNILEEQYRPFVYKFLIVSEHSLSIALPYKFLADLIHMVQGEPEGGPKRKVAAVASALDKLESEFKSRTPIHFPYKQGKVTGFTMEELERVKGYSYQSLLVRITPKVLAEYKKALGISTAQQIAEYQDLEDTANEQSSIDL